MARRQAGFTYVWVLALVAVLGIGLAAIGPMWHDDVKREREKDALRIGQLYLVHMGNGPDYRSLVAELPDWAAPAYDGLEIAL